MTPEQLKASIFQYAVSGKLVEQREEEGTGQELFNKIQEEKQRLIKEGKIKKEKALPEIKDDEIPFDIPDNWKWTHLNDIVLTVADIDHKMPECVEVGYPYISPLNFTPTGIDYDNAKMIGKEDFERLSQKCKPERGDIIFPRYGTIGVVRMVETDRLFLVSYSCCTIKNVSELVMPMYVYYGLQSGLIKQEINRYINKTTQPNIGLQSIKKFLFPLPPLAEQKRIVAKIEELLPIVDRYAVAYERLEKFNAKFPKDMKNSILQYAIQGNLVEQRTEEGTGEDLFNQIVANREALIKENVIKRDKRTETSVNPDEVPFDIPENWKWVTLGSILNKLTDGTHKTPKYTASGVKFVSVKDMSNGYLSLDNTKFISEEEHEELYARCNPERGDIILSKVGTTGVPAIVNTDEAFSLFVSVALLKFDHKCIDKKFLYYMLMSPLVQAQAKENTRGVGNKNWVLDAIGNTMVVLPPLAEQKRIVEEIEKLLPYCDKLVEEMDVKK